MEHNKTNEEVFENVEIIKRPIAITIICILGFIGAIFTIPLIFSDKASVIGSWYPSYLGFSAIVGVICMIGLWQMKKWAAYLYTGFVGLNQIVLLTMDVWNIMAIILPGIVIGITYFYLKRMD